MHQKSYELHDTTEKKCIAHCEEEPDDLQQTF